VRVTELALSQAVLPSLAKASIHEVEQLAEQRTGEPPRGMRPNTLGARRRLYVLARLAVTRYYAKPLTLEAVAKALASSPRQLQRAYAQFGDRTFRADLRATRMAAAAELLSKPALPVADVARMVGYRQAPHFARAFRSCYGVSPSVFRRAPSDATERATASDIGPAACETDKQGCSPRAASTSVSRTSPPIAETAR
jgi:AraC-like DNA-binding protein